MPPRGRAGYLPPRGGVAFVAVAGSPFTTLDFSHPATADGLLTTATVRSTQAPAAGCTAAMKLNGSFSSGDVRRGLEFGARASAGVCCATSFRADHELHRAASEASTS